MRGWSIALGSLVLASGGPATAQSVEPVASYSIPAGPLHDALGSFTQQAGIQLLYSDALVAGRRTAGVQGSLTAEAALTVILRDTGLLHRRTAANSFVLVDSSAQASPDPTAATLEEIVVTGSYLRGADSPSPVVILPADGLERRGRATVADALAALPQNFAGAAHEGSAATGADRSGVNVGYATGLNLRGLGADATLVLINGRRIAGTGGAGDFADISSIPSNAVERVDVLLDGASALYGADAVGGVVNLILRDQYEGAETRLRIGGTSGGGAAERLYGQTAGLSWPGGSLFGAYEYFDRSPLRAEQRRATRSADLRPLGGDDWREFYASPGNVMYFDPVAGGFEPAFAIPEGQDGVGLTPSDFIPGTVNLDNQNEGVWILPRQTRHSVFAAVRQDLPLGLSLDGEIRWSDRSFKSRAYADIALLTITDANPHFVSPDGSRASDIAYSFARELGPGIDYGDTEALGGSVEVEGQIHGWSVSAYVSGGRDSVRSFSGNRVNQDALAEALGTVPDDPSTSFATSRDGFFNPYGDPANNTAAMRKFIGSGFADARYANSLTTTNVRADGTLLHLPGGPLRVAVGLDHRTESYETQVTNFFFGSSPAPGPRRSFDRSVAAAFLEARIPIIGPDNAQPGIRRLELAIAGRTERYDDIGSSSNPKVGIIYEPAEGLSFRASYGESFRAPTLTELNSRYIILPTVLNDTAGDVITLMRYGGNPDLRPETATSLTAGFVWTPPSLDGLRLEANWFRTEFRDRIGVPASEFSDRALIDPALAPFVTRVSPGSNSADLALVEGFLSDPANLLPGAFPATSYGAIVDARYVNAASLVAEGVDGAVSYRLEAWDGDLNLEGAVTWLGHYDRQITPVSAVEQLVGQPHLPARWRGRAGGYWSRETVGAGLWAVYTGGSRDGVSGDPIDDWLTFDGQVRVALTSGIGSPDDLALTLNVQNLFNQEPPFYNAQRGLGYDAANANILGRQLSLTLTKSW